MFLHLIVWEHLSTAPLGVVARQLQLAEQALNRPMCGLEIDLAAHDTSGSVLRGVVSGNTRGTEETSALLTFNRLVQNLETNSTPDQVLHLMELFVGYLFDCCIIGG